MKKKITLTIISLFVFFVSIISVDAAVLTVDVNGGKELEKNTFEFEGKTKLSDILLDNEIDDSMLLNEDGNKELNGFLDSVDGNKYTGEEEIDEDITIYANWVDKKEVTTNTVDSFKIKFELNDGDCVDCDDQSVNKGGKVTKPTTPLKNGSDFLGWYIDSSLNNEFDFNTEVYQDYTLYAKWNEQERVELLVNNTSVDFGTVNVGFKSNIEKTVILKNNGNVDLTLSISNPTTGPFGNNGFEENYVIKPGEEYTVRLTALAGSSYNNEGLLEGEYTFTGRGGAGGAVSTKVKAKLKQVLPNAYVSYTTHVQNIGWQGYVMNGLMAGTSGQSLRLEGIKIKLVDQPYSGNIEYRTHIQNIGWESGFRMNNQISGTTGRSLRLEAIEIRLTGEMSKYYDVYYRVHTQNLGWLGWAKNGEKAGSAGYSYRLEGIEIKLVKKNEQVSGYGSKAIFYDKSSGAVVPIAGDKLVAYTTHIQNIGWQHYVTDGSLAGTTGQSLRLEAIKIKLVNQQYSGDIEYRTHIQNIGWESGYSKNYEASGTSGKSLRLEAIQIKLTGEMAEHYDVYYRVHAQNFGWLGWAKNGEKAGTAGYSYRLEAIEIELVEKGKEFNKGGEKIIFYDKSSGAYVSTRNNAQGWVTIDGNKYYYYENGTKATYLAKIDGVRYEFSKNGELQHSNIRLIADLSYHNGDIDFETLWNSGAIDEIIFRVGYSRTLDAKFPEYIAEAKRLGIPYSVYHFSYAENADEARLEAENLVKWYKDYNLNTTMGVFYDIEGWKTSRSNSDHISISDYDAIIQTYLKVLSDNGINMSLYTGKYYAETRLSDFGRSVISWIAHYNNNCLYMGSYRGWQYTSTGSLPGINGNVDLSIFYY